MAQTLLINYFCHVNQILDYCFDTLRPGSYTIYARGECALERARLIKVEPFSLNYIGSKF